MTGDSVATTVTAVEQTGQTWVVEALEVRSAHWWSCAPTKATTKSTAKNAILWLELRMYQV